MRIAILFNRFGPYHIARLKAAAKFATVIPIEISGETNDYQWDRVEGTSLQNKITLFEDETKISASELIKSLETSLDSTNPDVVAVNGWYDRSALAALNWCLKRKVAVLVMSESSERDEKRVWWKEIIKKTIIRQFDTAIVGGLRHANYLKLLGFKEEQIYFGYDVVDNFYFEKEASKIREQEDLFRLKKNLPENYFLVVSRFIDKKNLPFIIFSYNDYIKKAGAIGWHLYIVGDGPLKNMLVEIVKELGLNEKVHFEGFKQYNELPIYFGLANALIHASTVEQWGLVANEAMASGLPVVISDNCGCVPELVHDGINGFVIDPYDQSELTNKMTYLANNPQKSKEMGLESQRIIKAFDANLFGEGINKASMAALKKERKKSKAVSILLKTLIHRKFT